MLCIQVRVDHPGTPRAHATIGEILDMADTQMVIAKAAAQTEADDVVEAMSRQSDPRTECETPLPVQLLKGA